MTSLTVRPRRPHTTFLDFPLAMDLDQLEADFAIIGMPYGDPYTIDELVNDQTNAPTAIRRASGGLSLGIDHWNFDIGGTLFDGRNVRVVDVGDVPGDVRDLGRHYRLAEQAVRKILAAGAFPITIGGDHGIPIPVFRALSSYDPITLVHIDAHLDWRDEVKGVREGYSSPIRRASEMDHIDQIFQLGIRGQGSARGPELEAARAYGAHIVTSDEVHELGMAAIIDRIPDGGNYYLTIDADGLDPVVMPAVGSPQPGGLNFVQTTTLIRGLARKGNFVGMDIVEIMPARDLNSITSVTAGYIIMSAIGAVARARHAKNRKSG